MIKEFFRHQKAKHELQKAFRNAGLYNTLKRDKRDIKIYPKIHSIKFKYAEKQLEYVFTLLNGMDPKEIKRHEYVFKQHFSDNIELKGDYKNFTLTVFADSLPKELEYDYKAISSVIKGMEVPIVCGKDTRGNWVAYDSILEPNCLISGEPGSGKSTQTRSILTTLIQAKKPNELEIYLGDLKMSEFHLFYDVEHVKSVCIYPDDLRKMLYHIHEELKRRGELLNQHRETHVNRLPEGAKPPYILLCIDEFVMIMDDTKMKNMIVQIVSLGRALGIYCLLSLQRPSHDILDTKIRACLPVRMGFRTADIKNSMIIGTPGSETISVENRGRFLLKRDELNELQAPYLSEKDAKKILEGYKSQNWINRFTSKNESLQSDIKETSLENIFGNVYQESESHEKA